MYRIESEDVGARMPNLARNRSFQIGNVLVREWIAGLDQSEFLDQPEFRETAVPER
jgi:hypothetical protein